MGGSDIINIIISERQSYPRSHRVYVGLGWRFPAYGQLGFRNIRRAHRNSDATRKGGRVSQVLWVCGVKLI